MDEAGAFVQGDGGLQRAVGLQIKPQGPGLPRRGLAGLQKATGQPQPASGGRDGHLRHLEAVFDADQGATTEGLAVPLGDEDTPAADQEGPVRIVDGLQILGFDLEAAFRQPGAVQAGACSGRKSTMATLMRA
jgi:hypothetical protein